MESGSQAVLLHLKVRPGALHEYVVLAARPGVHLEFIWSPLGAHLPQLGNASLTA